MYELARPVVITKELDWWIPHGGGTVEANQDVTSGGPFEKCERHNL